MDPGSPQTIGHVAHSTGSPSAADRLAVALHLELLEVCGKPREMIVVRQHRVRRRLQEIPVPDPDEREQNGQASRDRRRSKCSSIACAAREHRREILPADRERDGEPDRGPHGVAPADPVPHREPPMRRDAELVHRLVVRRHRDALRGDRGLAAVLEQPLARGAAFVSVSSVVNVFEQITNSVVSGSTASSTCCSATPSMFDTKCTPSRSSDAARRAP